MDQNNKFGQVLKILQEQGYSEEEIVKITTDLSKLSFSRLYSEAMLSFTPEDLQIIEDCQTDGLANEKIKDLYTLRTGKDPDTEAKTFLENFSDEFLKQYEKDKLNKPPKTN